MPIFDKEKLCERFKQALKEKHINQTKMANALCVSPTYISRIKNGYQLPSTPFLFQIAEYLNISIDWLCGRSETP